MSGYYQRGYVGGPIAKKQRLGPRGPYMMPGHHAHPHPEDDGKRLMSFKEFIAQSADINEEDALPRYSEYKTAYTRRQIDEFFKAHQEEEWFRMKYRPTELKKIAEATKESKARRKELYSKLVEKQAIDFSLDNKHTASVGKFLEDFSLLLDGATLEDLDDPEARRKYAVSSIFFPSLHPSVDKATIEEHAKQRPDFLRVAMSDNPVDKGYRRRAWVTYKQMNREEIQQVAWEYNTNKFNGQEVKAIINKEMSNRVRYTKHWFCHEKAAKADLKNVAKLLTHYEGDDCPLLETIKDHLIEETDAEEQLLGVSELNVPEFEFKQDPEILKALDKIILYLRIVHSYDYYAASEYSGEDDMPQRIGIIFVRPDVPAGGMGDSPQDSLNDFIQAQTARIDAFLIKPTLSETEQKQLGSRNVDDEVESFIFQHTFEKVPGEKYICKLTKKKFTAPEYVRKHILTRCTDKLDEVRTEVEFFNNYIADVKRPM